jgi:hypothetical protein
VHAFEYNLLGGPFATPLRDAARQYANLVAYNGRMLDHFWAKAAAA